MTDIPHDIIDKIAALKLPTAKNLAVLQIFATFVGANSAKKGTALPDDWRPSSSDFDYGIAHGLTFDEVAIAAEEMRVWAAANRNHANAKKANWNMAFKGWLLREAKKRKPRNGAMDVILELEERSGNLHSTEHNGANGHVRGNGRNGKAVGGGLLPFFGPGDTNGTTRNR